MCVCARVCVRVCVRVYDRETDRQTYRQTDKTDRQTFSFLRGIQIRKNRHPPQLQALVRRLADNPGREIAEPGSGFDGVKVWLSRNRILLYPESRPSRRAPDRIVSITSDRCG